MIDFVQSIACGKMPIIHFSGPKIVFHFARLSDHQSKTKICQNVRQMGFLLVFLRLTFY